MISAADVYRAFCLVSRELQVLAHQVVQFPLSFVYLTPTDQMTMLREAAQGQRHKIATHASAVAVKTQPLSPG